MVRPSLAIGFVVESRFRDRQLEEGPKDNRAFGRGQRFHASERTGRREQAELLPSSPGTAADVYKFDLEALTPLAARIGPPADAVHTPLDRVPDAVGSPFWKAGDLTTHLNHV